MSQKVHQEERQPDRPPDAGNLVKLMQRRLRDPGYFVQTRLLGAYAEGK